jgi:hypothetical protein
MKDTETLLSGIEYKIRKLINLQKKLREENDRLKQEKIELLNKLEIQSKKLKESEEKNKIIRISKNLETNKDTKEVKLKINEIVREIDKCVSLLNR